MNNYCKKCRLRDGCLQKCKEAEVYEQGYNDAVKELKKLKSKKMEDNVKKVMDFIARIAFCEIDSYQYEKFLESIKNKIENELEWLTTHKVQPQPPKADRKLTNY